MKNEDKTEAGRPSCSFAELCALAESMDGPSCGDCPHDVVRQQAIEIELLKARLKDANAFLKT